MNRRPISHTDGQVVSTRIDIHTFRIQLRSNYALNNTPFPSQFHFFFLCATVLLYAIADQTTLASFNDRTLTAAPNFHNHDLEYKANVVLLFRTNLLFHKSSSVCLRCDGGRKNHVNLLGNESLHGDDDLMMLMTMVSRLYAH